MGDVLLIACTSSPHEPAPAAVPSAVPEMLIVCQRTEGSTPGMVSGQLMAVPAAEMGVARHELL